MCVPLCLRAWGSHDARRLTLTSRTRKKCGTVVHDDVIRSAMMRQTLLTPWTPAIAAAPAVAAAGGAAATRGVVADGIAVATSSAITAPPGPEPRSVRRSTPRSAARRRAFGDAATRRAAAEAGAAAAAPLPAGVF